MVTRMNVYPQCSLCTICLCPFLTHSGKKQSSTGKILIKIVNEVPANEHAQCFFLSFFFF